MSGGSAAERGASASSAAEARPPFDAHARREELEARTQALVEGACSAGAEEAEAFAVSRESLAVQYENGDLKMARVDERTSFGLRVFQGARMGFAATNQSDGAAPAGLTRDALELAAISPADEHNVLPEPGRAAREAPALDQGLCGWSVERACTAAQDMVARVQALDPRLSLDKASLHLGRTAYGISSSKGVRRGEVEASLSISLFGMAVDGQDVGGFDYWSDCTRELARVDEIIEQSVRRFAAAALGNLGAGAAETYSGRVLFSPAALQSLLISPLVAACSAIAVQRGRSALAQKLGQAVADPKLSVRDDPSDLQLSGNCTFDREGIAAEPFALLEAGVLQGWLYNGYAAHVDGVRSSGHAAGGTRAAPGIGAHALVVAAGQGGDEAAMRRRLGRGLVVQRFSGTVDPASGDFSGVAKSARWVEGGELVRSVRETLISGNAFELMRSIEALSSASERVMGSMRAPWALIDGVSVTAG